MPVPEVSWVILDQLTVDRRTNVPARVRRVPSACLHASTKLPAMSLPLIAEAGVVLEPYLPRIGIGLTAAGLALGKRQRQGKMGARKRLKFDPPEDERGVATPSRYRSQLGRPMNRFSTRRHTHFPPQVSDVKDRDLHVNRLINIPWSEDETQINRRRSNLVGVKAVRFRCMFQLLSNAGTSEGIRKWPIEIRWAVINPKNNDGSITAYNPTTGVSQFDNEFFISRNPGEQMSLSMNRSHNWWTYHKDRINREKYGVLAEGRTKPLYFPIGEQEIVTPNCLTQSMCHNLEIYIPIGKQIKFEVNDIASPDEWPEQNIYFVWWYTRMNDLGTNQVFTGGTNATPAVQFKYEATTYFKNSRMYA